jgi:hypothetical protein
MRLLRLAGYVWAFPVTAVGLGLTLLTALSGGRVQARGGAIEAHGGLARRLLRGNRFWKGGAAMAVGHVILARDRAGLECSRAHERIPVRQLERWGVLLPAAYLLVGWRLKRRGHDAYLDHPFEQETKD